MAVASAALSFAFLLLIFAASAAAASSISGFAEAPLFRNGESCGRAPSSSDAAAAEDAACDPSDVHIAMTLDSHYLRGSVAAVFSLLKHASCPDSLFFHFVAGTSDANRSAIESTVRAVFPSLRFRIYSFDERLVRPRISSSVRVALENPLNYARAYLADLLAPCVRRVVYLDSDLVVVDDVRRLWDATAASAAAIAAPEYCHANFTRYFTRAFWDRGLGGRVFAARSRRPCYFNTGVMVMDLDRWRAAGYRRRIERWMEVQRERRIYELGSLPPFLLVFAGEVEPVDHRWNQHGLGGDNVDGRCRTLHPGPVSLMHWSGKGKPWDRLDAGVPCPVDHLWEPYDLYIRPTSVESVAAADAAVSSAILSW